ncbi:TPA: hypothetical protein ACQ51W_002987 [Legionella pneumophila]
MDPLETNVTYFVIGKRIKTLESESKLRKKISDEELKEAVPIEEAWLFRTREEADNYAIGTQGYNSKVPECPRNCVAIFEVQLRNPVAKPKTDTIQINPQGSKMIEFQFARVDADNLGYISGGVPGIQGKYQFKPTDEANIKTPKEWLDKIGFDRKIEDLDKKASMLGKEDARASEDLAFIIGNLKKYKREFLDGHKSAEQFVEACRDEIKPEKTKNLANHRGIFASVTSFIESIVQLVSPKYKINTDSINKINEVEKSLGEIKPERVVKETGIAKRTIKSDYEVDSDNTVAKAGDRRPGIKPG